MWTAGQVIGLIHDIPTCAELLSRIEREAAETLSKTASLYTSDGTDEVADSNIDRKGRQTTTSGNKLVESGSGTKSANTNDPGAELWGVGKSKL